MDGQCNLLFFRIHTGIFAHCGFLIITCNQKYSPPSKCNATVFTTGQYKHWTQGLDPKTKDQGPTRSPSLSCTAAVRQNKTTGNLCSYYKPKLTAMSCTSSLCTQKALFIADNTISTILPLTSLILRVVSYQSCKFKLAHRVKKG